MNLPVIQIIWVIWFIRVIQVIWVIWVIQVIWIIQVIRVIWISISTSLNEGTVRHRSSVVFYNATYRGQT